MIDIDELLEKIHGILANTHGEKSMVIMLIQSNPDDESDWEIVFDSKITVSKEDEKLMLLEFKKYNIEVYYKFF